MGTALYTGVTGLLAHQRRLDVIASNISNVNTPGYRGSRMLFQDLFSQTLEGATAPTTTLGGTNPEQIGLGVRIGAVDVDFNQASLTTTGVASDLAIQGSGFFILSNGTVNHYTRDGSFTINGNGELVDSGTGFRVQGYIADATGVVTPTGPPTNLTIPVGGISIVRATTTADLVGNLNSGAAAGDTVQRTIQVHDSLGTARDIQLTFTKSATPNEWTWAATSSDPEVNAVTGAGTITFTGAGAFSAVTSDQISVDFIDTIPALPTDPLAFTADFTQLTMLSAQTDVTLAGQDGYARGVLQSFNIGQDGLINGVFSNGLSRTLGQVALASFANNGGLVREGNNMFLETPGSGVAQIGAPSTGGRGQVAGGVLEGSNVDLGTEFSNLIMTQRGFQANARTITAADTLLQETVNLVR